MAESTDENVYSEGVNNAVNDNFESAEDPLTSGEVSPERMDAVQDQSDTVQDTREAQEAHTNGHAEQGSSLENGDAPSAEPAEPEQEGTTDPAPGQQEEPREEPWKKRLYFVRMPKFPEENQYASKTLQEELDLFRSQGQLLNESMNVIRVRGQSISVPAHTCHATCRGHVSKQFLKWVACTLTSSPVCRCSATVLKRALQKQGRT